MIKTLTALNKTMKQKNLNVVAHLDEINYMPDFSLPFGVVIKSKNYECDADTILADGSGVYQFEVNTITKLQGKFLSLKNNKVNELIPVVLRSNISKINTDSIGENETNNMVFTSVSFDLLYKIASCMSKNDTRVFLNAVCFYFDDNSKLVGMAATDAHRLIKWGETSEYQAIINHKYIDFILACKPKSFEIAKHDNYFKIKFECDNEIVTIIDKALDCNYVDINRVTKNNNDLYFNLNCSKLVELKKSINGDKLKALHIDLVKKRIGVIVHKNSGNDDTIMWIDDAIYHDISQNILNNRNFGNIKVNINYMIDFAKLFKNGIIKFSTYDTHRILAYQEDGLNYAVMPLRS